MTEKLFCAAIESLRNQSAHDKKTAEILQEAFGSEVQLYDNSGLIKTILSLLQIHFPKNKLGFCGIEFYCFDQNFGKPSGDSEFETPEKLYRRLCLEKTQNQIQE